jgi:hypothetical protein
MVLPILPLRRAVQQTYFPLLFNERKRKSFLRFLEKKKLLWCYVIFITYSVFKFPDSSIFLANSFSVMFVKNFLGYEFCFELCAEEAG